MSERRPSAREGDTIVLRMTGGADSSSRCECLCGSLLARWVEEGIELKCRRCRRLVVVPCVRPERSPDA